MQQKCVDRAVAQDGSPAEMHLYHKTLRRCLSKAAANGAMRIATHVIERSRNCPILPFEWTDGLNGTSAICKVVRNALEHGQSEFLSFFARQDELRTHFVEWITHAQHMGSLRRITQSVVESCMTHGVDCARSLVDLLDGHARP